MQTEPATAVASSPVVVFGRDAGGKAHASRFEAADAAQAERAAGIMGMQVLRIVSDEHAGLAAMLPAGRVFASGRAFTPFTKAELFDRLAAAPGAFTPAPPADPAPRPARAASKPAEAQGGPGGGAGSGLGGAGAGDPPDARPPAAPKRPRDWPEIGIGSHVLACHAPQEGWYEAVVAYTRPDRTSFTLRWRDWPDEPEIVRARKDLGLLPVSSREGVA